MRLRSLIAPTFLISALLTLQACATADKAIVVAQECLPQEQALAACVKEHIKPTVNPSTK